MTELENIDEAIIDRIATAVASKIRPSVDTQKAWTYQDAANYLGVSSSTVRRMEKQPSFPQPRRMQTDDSGRYVTRFVAQEIIDWHKRKPVSRAS